MRTIVIIIHLTMMSINSLITFFTFSHKDKPLMSGLRQGAI